MLSIGDSSRRISTMHPDLQEGESLQVAPTRHQPPRFLKAVGHRRSLANRWLILRPAQLYVHEGLPAESSVSQTSAALPPSWELRCQVCSWIMCTGSESVVGGGFRERRSGFSRQVSHTNDKPTV